MMLKSGTLDSESRAPSMKPLAQPFRVVQGVRAILTYDSDSCHSHGTVLKLFRIPRLLFLASWSMLTIWGFFSIK